MIVPAARSTQSRVRPASSPKRRPPNAAVSTSARKCGGTASANAHDLRERRDRALGAALDSRTDDRARIPRDQAVSDGGVQDRPQEPVALGRRQRARPASPDELRVPAAHGPGAERADLVIAERGDDVVLEQRLVQVDGARAQVGAGLDPAPRRTRRAKRGRRRDRSRCLGRTRSRSSRATDSPPPWSRSSAAHDGERRRATCSALGSGRTTTYEWNRTCGACSSFGSRAGRRDEAPQRRDPEPAARDRAEPSSASIIGSGCVSERGGTRAAVIQSATSTGSKRTNRPTLTYGIRRSATSRRTCRSVTHRRSATAPMSNNVESSSTSSEWRVDSRKRDQKLSRQTEITHVASRCTPTPRNGRQDRHRYAGCRMVVALRWFRSVADRLAVGLSNCLSPAGWLLIDWSAAG